MTLTLCLVLVIHLGRVTAFATCSVGLTNGTDLWRFIPDSDVLLQDSKVPIGGGQFLGGFTLGEWGFVHRAIQLSWSILAVRFRTAQLHGVVGLYK